jgi:hypothetical protein
LKKNKYDKPYYNMTLRHPLYPGQKEPEYIFGMMDGTFVGVGAITGKTQVLKK